MNSQSSEIKQGKRIKVGDKDSNHDDLQVAAVCHDFWKEAPEDILLEIFIRLPDSRSAVRSDSVCHKWHSVISHNPLFIPRFESHHRQHHGLYAIMFRKADKKTNFGVNGAQDFQPICKIYSKDSMFCTKNFLSFLPTPMVIRASCKDLLLVSPGSRLSTHLYVCNPITKQFVRLPEVLRPSGIGCAAFGYALLVSSNVMSGGCPTNQFKVVEFFQPVLHDFERPELYREYMFQPTSIYCSKSGKWERRNFAFPRSDIVRIIFSMDIVTCNGILYWLEYERKVHRVIYLDLSSDKCGAIGFPDDYYYQRENVREQIGGVRARGGGGEREELRLIQVVLKGGRDSIVDLKVWKLMDPTTNNSYYKKEDEKVNNWVLVHEIQKLNRPKEIGEQKFVAPFVHPIDGDVVFMVWGKSVVEYNLKYSRQYQMLMELEEELNLTDNTARNVLLGNRVDRLLPFPMARPAWPTPLPKLDNPSG